MSLRVLVAVTHLLGAGHLTRAAALARAFAKAGHDTTLASGGMPAPLIRTDGVRLVQLPPVRTVGTDFRTLLDESGQPVTPARLEARRDMLIELIDTTRPDVVVTELFPFGRRGLAGEFMALAEHAKASRPETLVLSSVRDVLVAPAKPERIAQSHETLRRVYDAVLVHGDAELIPLEASWPLNDGARALLRYTGYVDDGSPVEPVCDSGTGEIVVSGGSSAASLPLYRTALAAAALMSKGRWRILVGGGVAEAEFASLLGAAPPNAMLERARADFRSLLAGAAVSVSQAGYNTVIDVLRSGCRAVFVPFEQGHETEQRLRAEHLAARGCGEVLLEADLSSAYLAERVDKVLQRPRADVAMVRLDGAEQSVAIVEELAGQRQNPVRPSRMRKSSASWHLVDEALSRAAERGAKISFWWRDDDAVAATPPLERLLGLARTYRTPVAIAAIPKSAEASLIARLAGEPLAHVLAHGLVHTNHARHGHKKAEFGLDRPLSRLVAEADEALRTAKAKFGGSLLPVFVPPWNRIAAELVPELPNLGYQGLSTFGPVPVPGSVSGLVQANTHLDLVDWHGGRGLRAPESLLVELAAAITSQGQAPIGLLSHHLVHDEATWSFCEELLSRLAEHTMVHIEDPSAMFAGAQTFSSWNGDLRIRLS
jgi:predicted glycosyltransferase